jgi:hypothetical protein
VTEKKVGGLAAAKTKKSSKPTPEEEEAKAIDALMTEVESDLRDEQLRKLWDSYKGWIFGAAAAVVLAVAAYQTWQGIVVDRLAVQADAFARATEQMADGNQDAALTELLTVAEDGGAYGVLAELRRAGILLEQDKPEDAVAIYRTLSTEVTLDPVFSDLATLLWGIHGLDSEDPETLAAALETLTDPSNAYSYSALELMALLAVRRGALDEARAILDQLLQDTNTPVGVRSRAGELAAVFAGPSTGESAAPAEIPSEGDSQVDAP